MSTAKRGKGIELLEVPDAMVGLSDRRCKPIVAHAANLARFGTLDLNQLAMSCYLQGIHDAFQATTGRAAKEIA